MDMTAYFLGKVASDASGGGSVQPDYLQNNPSAKDYIKNRPFYSEITTEIDGNIIIPSQEVEGMIADGLPEGYLGFILEELDSDSIKKLASIVDKGQYNLIIDGTTKQITTTFVPDVGVFFFGNLSLAGMGDDTGETYIGSIEVRYNDHHGYRGNVMLALQTTETTHTIGLSHIGEAAPIIAEDTYSFENIEDGSTCHFFTNMWEASFEGDNVYNLTFDDEIYEGLSWIYHEVRGMNYLGNPSIVGIGDDTGEKYFLARIPQDDGNVILIMATSYEEGNYTFSLEKSLVKTIETIHKMDSKYIDVPYTKDDEGNVIFEKDIYVNEVSVSQSLEQISEDREEINTKLSEIEKSVIEQEENNAKVKNIVEDFPRPLIKGLTAKDNVADVPYGLSAGSGYPNGTFAWSEGSSGAIPNSIPYSLSHKLVIEKNPIIKSYIQYTMMTTTGAWTAEDHIANLNKYSFLKIKFYDEQKIYFVKRREVTAENNVIKIQFSFLSYEDKFDISEPTSGRSITELATIETLGDYSHSEGELTKAKGRGAHSEGYSTEAFGEYSHVEGCETIASGDYSHVQGKFNVEDTENKYSHIIGNGKSITSRSNAHTVDWDGNAWYAGSVESEKILTKDLVTAFWSGANITPVASGKMVGNVYSFDGKLTLGEYYLFVLNGVEYRSVCQLDHNNDLSLKSLDDSENQSWEVYEKDENSIYVSVYASYAGATISVSKVDLRIVNLCDYIDKLEARIKTLEDAQAAIE